MEFVHFPLNDKCEKFKATARYKWKLTIFRFILCEIKHYFFRTTIIVSNLTLFQWKNNKFIKRIQTTNFPNSLVNVPLNLINDCQTKHNFDFVHFDLKALFKCAMKTIQKQYIHWISNNILFQKKYAYCNFHFKKFFTNRKRQNLDKRSFYQKESQVPKN